MQEFYKKYMAIHHANWDALVNKGKMKEADLEMKNYNYNYEMLQVAIRNNLH